MFKDHQSYLKAEKRIQELLELDKSLSVRLSYDDQEELDRLIDARGAWLIHLEAEAQAEHEFMQKFEDRFMESMDR